MGGLPRHGAQRAIQELTFMQRARGYTRTERERLVLEMVRRLNEATRPRDVLVQLVRLAMEATSSFAGAAAMVGGPSVVLVRQADGMSALELDYPPKSGLSVRAIADARAHLAGSAERDGAVDPGLRQALGFGSTLAAPLVRASRDAVGCLQLFARRSGGLGEADLSLVETLAEAATGALLRACLLEQRARECEELREAAGRFRTLADSSPDFVWEVDAGCRYTYCGAATRELLGYEPAELIGKTPFDLMPAEEAQRLRAPVQQAFLERAAILVLENVNAGRDGRRVVLQTSGVPYFDVTGDLAGYRGVDRDITRQQAVLDELSWHSRFEHLIATISSRFISVDSKEIDGEIQTGLEMIGRFADVDRAYVIRFDGGQQSITCTHEWCMDGVEPAISQVKRLPVASLPWAMKRHLRGEVMSIDSLNDLPEAAAAERELFAGQGIKSIICVPLQCDGVLLGFVGFDAVREQRTWSEPTTMLLKLVGEIIAGALERKAAICALEEMTQVLRRSEVELTESRRMLQVVLDTIPARVFWKNCEGVYLGCNRAFAVDAGVRSPAEIVSKNDFDLPWKEHAAAYRADDRNVIITGMEKRLYREALTDARGRRARLRTSKVPLRGSAGEIIGVLGTFEDVTEQERSEEALRASEARLRRAIMNAPLPAAIHADGGEVLLVNRAWCELSGYSREELPTVVEWLRHAYPQCGAEKWRQVAKIYDFDGQRGDGEHDVTTKHGERRIWDFSSTALGRLEDGRRMVLTMAKDVTDRRHADERVRQLNAELEGRVRRRTEQLRALAIRLTQAEQCERRRIAHILHEGLQQLLVGAKLHVGIMAKSHSSKARSAAAMTVLGTLEEAIRVSRSLAMELRPPVLHDLGLVAALEWLARQVRARYGVRVQVVAEHVGEPALDDVRIALFECVQELLFNVVKHSGSTDAQVLIGLEGGRLQITVRDHGAGFDPSRLVAGSETGAGIGLFSLRERLEPFGGALSVDSKPGCGTTARIVVPLGPERSAQGHAGEDRQASTEPR